MKTRTHKQKEKERSMKNERIGGPWTLRVPGRGHPRVPGPLAAGRPPPWTPQVPDLVGPGCPALLLGTAAAAPGARPAGPWC